MSEPPGLLEALKQRGIRVTPQRAIILNAVEQTHGHMTAEQIYAQVKRVNSYINLATVYRTLELLRQLDLVTEADMGAGAMHYAMHTHATHHHAVCRTCGRSIEFPHELLTPLLDALHDRYQFRADADHIVIFGWCDGCLHSSAGTPSYAPS
mgnify:CR=1 FL=1